MPDSLDNRGDTRPVPDPTALTREATSRLEAVLRNLITSEIEHQNALFNEKLATLSIQFNTKFTMLDARTAEQKQDTTNALNAALAAQKEAVAAQTASSEKSITKSETATTERIKGVETLLATSTKATDDKITDLKDRVIAIEAVKLGVTEATATGRQGGADTRGIVAIVISCAFLVIAVASILITILKP
jgi:transketolase